MGRLAPGRLVAVLVPDADFPKALGARRERLAGVADLDRLVGLDAAAVPEVAFVLREFFRRAGDEDLVRASALSRERREWRRTRDSNSTAAAVASMPSGFSRYSQRRRSTATSPSAVAGSATHASNRTAKRCRREMFGHRRARREQCLNSRDVTNCAGDAQSLPPGSGPYYNQLRLVRGTIFGLLKKSERLHEMVVAVIR